MPTIARVFPRKTNASPDDYLAFFGPPPKHLRPGVVDEIHVSVTFTYVIPIARKLATQWQHISPVKIGGPALGHPGSNFITGMYLKQGYIITSRGCPNNCWFCDVHKREGNIRELPIMQGSNLLDSNILACSIEHIRKVFKILKEQSQPTQLTGGLEAKRLTYEHVLMLWDLRPKQMFFAYDTPDDLSHLVRAGELLRFANFTRQHLRCYVLIGWPKDSIDEAEKRLIDTWEAGFMPMAMVYKDKTEHINSVWKNSKEFGADLQVLKLELKKYLVPH